jgi:uncharacterized protein (TIGR02246 family)
MNIEEAIAREQIRDTMARYNMAGDRARADEMAEVFAEDGVLETPGYTHQGREAIRSWMKNWRTATAPAAPAAKADSAPKAAKFVRHNITTSQIDFTGPDTAKARTYFVVFTQIGPDHSGYYADEFKKVGDKWLISHRRAMMDWRAAESTFGMEVSK